MNDEAQFVDGVYVLVECLHLVQAQLEGGNVIAQWSAGLEPSAAATATDGSIVNDGQTVRRHLHVGRYAVGAQRQCQEVITAGLFGKIEYTDVRVVGAYFYFIAGVTGKKEFCGPY